MKVVYLSSSCSEEKFSDLQKSGITQKMPQAQKYHRLLMEGIAANSTVDEFTAISSFPTNRQWTKKVAFRREEECVGQIRYIYESFINAPILRQVTRYIGACKNIRRICKGNKCEYVIICDILNQSIADAAITCGKRWKIPVLGIVTDVPGLTSGARKKTLPLHMRVVKTLAEKRAKKKMTRYDAYLLLTEEMNGIVNPYKKPHIVIEGQCDVKMAEQQNSPENKASPKVILYAGGIHVEFGIERLVSAFIQCNLTGWELHIYGDGNFQRRLIEIGHEHPNVKYFGVRPNSEIVSKQIEATLLVNPRLTDAEYVKYSFPSKTLECMVSGTPLLTTKLPGMPKEYNEYVYLFESETLYGFCEMLSRVCGKSTDELHAKGVEAKAFVISHKNNVSQADNLCAFIDNLIPNDTRI